MPFRILSISYDGTLLKTRHDMLHQRGYVVTSAEGFTEAMEQCHAGEFDLVVIGHSIPHNDKEALFSAVQESCAAPVIALSRGSEPQLKGAADTVDPMDPKCFLKAVEKIASSKRDAKV